MLGSWQDVDAVTAGTEGDEDEHEGAEAAGMSRTLTPDERALLERFVKALEANQERDPKYAVVLDCLKSKGWLARGCIVFSQYFDSVRWLAEQLVQDLPGERIAIYAGSGKSGIWQEGQFAFVPREEIKQQVRKGQLRLVLGTDAASEGLNLQRLATLINLDLPWNPTRLEQRKGRIQRIGQLSDTVYVYNMRYVDSVEDRVHQLLSSRLQDIYTLFGQVPDVLEDVWIDVALGQLESAKQVIAAVPKQHPFDIKYQRIEKIDWESCERVLSAEAKRAALSKGW
jgi:superfamily II DNA/RNA helicase